MRIAVNTRFLQKDNLEGYGHYINELLQRITQQNLQHQFLFLFDKPFDASFIYSQNITSQILTPAARHGISFRYWYDVKLTRAAKKFKADVIVSLDGFCSLTTSIPQVVAVHDLAFLHYPKFISTYHLWFYKLHQKKFINKAKHVVTVSEFSKQDIVQQYKIAPEKISIVSNAAREIFVPITYTEKENIKTQYANGNEYFLFIGGIHPRKNLMHLLKAFSVFKKRQQSNMKILIVGRLAWQYDTLIEQLKTYKYRDDIELLNYLQDDKLAKILAAAYALIYPSFFEGFGVPIIEAMQCGVPVIASNTSSMPEVGGNAALYASPTDVNELAELMMQLYKNETMRNQMIQLGFTQSAKFSWDESAKKLWQIIEGVSKK